MNRVANWLGLATAVLLSAAANPAQPSLFVAGDSAWGKSLPRYFDLSKINVVNGLSGVGKNDYALIQFGQGDTLAMIHETQAKGAMPILCGLGQARQAAETEGVAFVECTNKAQSIIAGIKALRENGLISNLSPAGRKIAIAAPDAILMPHLKRPSFATARADFLRWLNLPDPANPALPDLFLIGDSTVRNGRGDGIDGLGQWGWGDPLAAWFDPAKINVVNRAVGGTGARTFMAQGYWDKVLALLKPGDLVIMQFGHNDNGPTAPIKGVGDETEVRNGETIHSWGWYLRKYIADTRAKGATAIVCTLIPRNIWEAGKIIRTPGTHADWAREVAKAENVPLLDLYERIAERYDAMGEATVTALFADKRVHTTKAGAELNASIVVAALRALADDPAAPFLRKEPAPLW